MEVASTKYPRHKTQINWRLTSVNFTLPPLQGTIGSPNNFCNNHGGGGDDDDDMLTTITIYQILYGFNSVEKKSLYYYYYSYTSTTQIILNREYIRNLCTMYRGTCKIPIYIYIYVLTIHHVFRGGKEESMYLKGMFPD